jgi:chromosome segregation ATPase
MQAEIYSNGQTELDKTQSYEFSSRMNKQLLKRQQRNLRIVGVLWLLEKGKVDPKAVVDYLIIQIDAESSSNTTLHEVSLYLANQYFSSEVRLIRALSILRYEISTLTQSKSQLEKLVGQKENQILQLQQYQSSQKQAVEKSRQEVLGYQAEIDNLKNQLNNQELDARANRTHLRDSEEKVKAKAFNLLSEDVLEKLKLSLNALARESPKIGTAIHQIELVIEDIERDLQWFKE